ncbi:c-type cytochrome [Acidobacteriota bacterium]
MKFIADKLIAFSPKFSHAVYKGALVAILAMAFVIPLFFVALPYIEFFNGMAVQPKGLPQSQYGRLYGKELLVERLPVEGTLPLGYEPYPLEGNDEATIALAGDLLSNPVLKTLENLKRGRQVYEIYCIVCHGATGLGDGGAVGPEKFPAPPSLHTDAVKQYKDGQIFHIITRGKGKMPPYDTRIRPDDRWAAVNYVHVLHRALSPDPGDLEPEDRPPEEQVPGDQALEEQGPEEKSDE